MKKTSFILFILTYLINTSVMAEFKLSSSGFKNLEKIPKRYTCLGQNQSPDLSWTNPPTGTESFALCVKDPDAPGGLFIHWIAYNIPSDLTELPEGIEKTAVTLHGICQGLNHLDQVGYTGPCPPAKQIHRYIFTIYALDCRLTLPPLTTYETFTKEIQPHILNKAEFTGLFN